MTNRYPLILDTQDGAKIKEIPQGDSLYLSGNTIEEVGNINSVGIINAAEFRVNNQTIGPTEFIQLTDTPTSYSGQNNKILKVKNDGSGLEFVNAQDIGLLSGTDITITGNIYPSIDNTGEIGLSSKKWNIVRATSLQGNLLNDNGSVIFDSSTGKITGTAISGNNISIFTNDSNYLTLADLSGTNAIDIQGNVIASDDSVIIDNVTKTFTGNVTGNASLNTLVINENIYNDSSTLIYDSSSNTFSGNFFGTFTGTVTDISLDNLRSENIVLVNSLFADDSSVLIDAVAQQFNGDVSYTPATPLHWSDPKPTTVAEALDKIAEILYNL